jgi:hypothetical protein
VGIFEYLEGVFMKSKGWLIVSLAVSILTVMVVGCKSNDTEGEKTITNSEVVVRRIDSNANIRVRVFIDGRQTGTLRMGETATYKIKNGEHTIFVNSDSYADREPSVIEFTAYQSRHVFAITDGMISSLSQSQFANAPASGAADRTSEYNLDSATKTSFAVITKDLKSKAKIAIINIASENPNEGDFIIEELTYLAVHSKKNFVVIDRRKIEAIRIEKYFDRTSNYEDDFLISIGHLLGAEVIITGSISGQDDLRRLRVKALDVKTAQLITMASEKI